MQIRPHTLSFITTYQCTSECSGCCFSCSPKKIERLSTPKMAKLIDEAMLIPSIKVIVFTGGEATLLGDDLLYLIKLGTKNGFTTRLVSNGFWAVNHKQTKKRLDKFIEAGLNEINFSWGYFHSQFVPMDNILRAAKLAVEFGLTTAIAAEKYVNGIDYKSLFQKSHELKGLVDKIHFLASPWICKEDEITEDSKKSSSPKQGCHFILSTLAVLPPDNRLFACCGLTIKDIPELELGNLNDKTLYQVISEAKNDLLKMWLNTHGPDKIITFLKKVDSQYSLPQSISAHPCESCKNLFNHAKTQSKLEEHIELIDRNEILDSYLSQIAVEKMRKNIAATLPEKMA